MNYKCTFSRFCLNKPAFLKASWVCLCMQSLIPLQRALNFLSCFTSISQFVQAKQEKWAWAYNDLSFSLVKCIVISWLSATVLGFKQDFFPRLSENAKDWTWTQCAKYLFQQSAATPPKRRISFAENISSWFKIFWHRVCTTLGFRTCSFSSRRMRSYTCQCFLFFRNIKSTPSLAAEK